MNFNPFVGPSPLGFGQKIYGRDREIRELFYLLAAERIAWLHSPSGAGKTSLVQSGLIPKLLDDDFAVLPIIRVSWQPPTELARANRFTLSVLVSLEEHREGERRLTIEELAELSMRDYLEVFEKDKDDEKCPVLLFDQFEEVLTVDPLAHSARRDFFEELAHLLEDRRFWALFSLREDYLAPLAAYAEVLPTRMNHLFRLDLLGSEAARLTIVETAREGGRRFEGDAAKKLVRDLTGLAAQAESGQSEDEAMRHVEPVQLQVVCRSLWERVDADQQRIGPQDLHKIGNVDQALQDYYAERLTQVAQSSGIDERLMRDWFDRQLITEAGLRGQVLRGDESSGGLPNRAVFPLVDAHLIRTERRRGLVWIELAHDRLVGPVRSDNVRWREDNLSLLARNFEAWEQAGRPANNPRLLLSGEELGFVEQWLEGPGNQATDDEAVYLETCLAAEAAAEARRRQARRERRLWRLSAVACLAIAVLCYEVWQDKLESRRETARGYERAAEVALREAYYEEGWIKTLKALELTDERLPVSLGRLLLDDLQPSSVRPASLIREGLKLPKGEQLHGLWLDRSGDSKVFTVSSRHVIEKYYYRLRWLDLKAQDSLEQRLPISLDEARSYAWDAQGQRLAVGDWRGQVTLLQWWEGGWEELWNETLSDQKECKELCDVLSLSFDATGRRLAAGGIGQVARWELRADGSSCEDCGQQFAKGQRLQDPERQSSTSLDEAVSKQSLRVMGLAFHPQGHQLAVGLEDGRVLVHTDSGDVTQALDFGIGGISVLRYIRDGWLVAGGGEAVAPDAESRSIASLVLWHQESGEWVRPQAEAKALPTREREIDHGVVSLAIHPKRLDIIASGLKNGEVRLWRRHPAKRWLPGTGSLELLAVIAAHSQAVTGLAFRGDGLELLSAAGDGRLRRFSLRLQVKSDPGGDDEKQTDTEEHDAIEVLVEPDKFREFMGTLLDRGSPSEPQAIGVSGKPLSPPAEESSCLAGSDAWNWNQIREWSISGENQGELCVDHLLSEKGQLWLLENGAEPWKRSCELSGVCKCEVTGGLMTDDSQKLKIMSAGTLQKTSLDGRDWYVFIDHKSKLRLSRSKAEELCKDLKRNDPKEDGAVHSAVAPVQRDPRRFAEQRAVAGEFLERQVTFRRVTLNDQPDYIEVLPRKEVRIEFDWKVELAEPESSTLPCETCQFQLYYGLADPLIDKRYDSGDKKPGFSKCLANAVMGPGYRGDSGSRTHSFQAPDRPGIYYVTWRFGMDYICRENADDHLPDFSKALATVRVLGDYVPRDEVAKKLEPSDVLMPSEEESPHALNRLAVDPQKRRVAIASFGGRARVWIVDRLRRGSDDKPPMTQKEDGERLTDVAWHPNGSKFLTASVDKKAILWSAEGQKIASFEHSDRVLAADFSPDGKKVLTACRDGRAYLWDILNEENPIALGKEDYIAKFDHLGDGADVVSAVFSPDGDRVLTASRDLTARIWDLQGNEIVSLTGHSGWLKGAIFSPQGRYVATASDDKKVRVWRTQDFVAGSENPAPWIRGSHEDAVSAFAFSPDEQLLATASLDGRALLWRLSTSGKEPDVLPIARLEGHEDIIFDLAFSPDGRWIATASHDKTARVWRVENAVGGSVGYKEPLAWQATYRLEGHDHSVLSVRFIDSQRLVTASFDGTASLWDLDQRPKEKQ